ncbi:MAG: ATP-binding cassette domain-containing protein [Klebsiella pneumoniae]|nr:ATP-binding cassette domain-containing protein [Klebsiella pneumoniae]
MLISSSEVGQRAVQHRNVINAAKAAGVKFIAYTSLLRPIPRREQNEIAERFIRQLGIRTPSAEQPIEFLSGGNQQKVLLSRWLLTKPQFLILDEPTRGIDVGAHAEIIRLIETLCADGLALLVISSELEELVGYADRVIILRDRRQVAEIPLAELSVPAIMNAIAA